MDFHEQARMRMPFHNSASESEAIEVILRQENRRLGSELTARSYEADELRRQLNKQSVTYSAVVRRLRRELQAMTVMVVLMAVGCAVLVLILVLWQLF
jgi:hypothetical protein